MLLQRTEKARVELQPGVRTLGLRERSVLLMANGSKSLADLYVMFDGQGKELVTHLLASGFLEPAGRVRATRQAPAPSTALAPSLPATQPVPVQPRSAADSFDGKRSLATTRMFLFDICERMFARRDPKLAENFREALRQAKDRVTMLDAARSMITEIERVAGHERADSISERIAMLLPPETLT